MFERNEASPRAEAVDQTRPRVSVITGYYNRARFVERTLSSLCEQSLEDIEIIVFDDASKDDTAASISNFIRETGDQRVKPIYHQKNIGFTRGMINAIRASRGEYIAVQGSGDRSLPTRLARQVKLLENDPNIGLVGSHFINRDEAGISSVLRQPAAEKSTLASLRAKNIFAHGEVMMRRSAYDAAGGYRPIFKYSADYDLWLRMITVSKFATVPEVLYERYMLTDGVSYNPQKAIEMVKYHALGWKLSFDQSRYAAIADLPDGRPFDIDRAIPDSDAKVKKKLTRLALRFAYFGDFDKAKIVADRVLPKPIGRLISVAVTQPSTRLLITTASKFRSLIA